MCIEIAGAIFTVIAAAVAVRARAISSFFPSPLPSLSFYMDSHCNPPPPPPLAAATTTATSNPGGRRRRNPIWPQCRRGPSRSEGGREGGQARAAGRAAAASASIPGNAAGGRGGGEGGRRTTGGRAGDSSPLRLRVSPPFLLSLRRCEQSFFHDCDRTNERNAALPSPFSLSFVLRRAAGVLFLQSPLRSDDDGNVVQLPSLSLSLSPFSSSTILFSFYTL